MAFQEQVTDAIDQAGVVRAEVDSEVGAVELSGFTIRLVEDVLVVETESSGLAVLRQVLEGALRRLCEVYTSTGRRRTRSAH